MPTEAYAHGGLCPMPARAPHVTEKGYIKDLPSQLLFQFLRKSFNWINLGAVSRLKQQQNIVGNSYI